MREYAVRDLEWARRSGVNSGRDIDARFFRLDGGAVTHSMRVAGLSDIGCRRSNNEDSFGFDEAAGIYVVSDGMGGGAAGEVASHLAVRETLASFIQGRSTVNAGGLPIPVQDLLFHSVVQASAKVYETGLNDPSMAGMGATLVCACFDGANAVVANVGDSRAYLLRRGSCTQITQDHSVVAERVRAGLWSMEQAERSPERHVLTRAVGVRERVEPDLFAAQLLPGDKLLLATDGLMGHLSDAEIGTLVDSADDVEEACALLIAEVKQRGANDNVTCLLIETQ